MNAETMRIDATEAQQTCDQDYRLAEAAWVEAKELAAWMRFGTLSYEDYVSWVAKQYQGVARQA